MAEAPDSTANPTKVVDESEYGQTILAKLNEFRHDSLFTDAVLCVGEEEFPCHKNVLAVSSPYFQAMFTSDLRESRESRISFNEVSPLTLKRIIDYAYSGKVEISTSNAQEMLAAACLFQYPAIVSACEDFLENQLHASNCLCIEIFAQLHSCTTLQDSARKFALENFTSVVEQDEFLELAVDRLQEYISSDLIDVRTEETVFSAVLRWVNFDLESREKLLPELLANVRLGVLDSCSLQMVETDPLVSASPQCLELLREAEKLKLSFRETEGGKRRRSMQDSLIQPRPSTVAKEVLVILGGVCGRDVSNAVDMYDPHRDRWLSLPDLPQPALWSSVTVLGNCIFVAGGIRDGHSIDKVWKFDPRQRKWMAMPPMLKPRARHAAAVLEDKMYVFGGVRYERKLLRVETIECYNPATNTWTAAGRTMFPRQESCVVPYNNTIVEVGGLQGEEAVVKTMDSYHIVSDGTIRPSGEQIILPEPIRFAKIVVVAGVFYIIWEDSGKVIALNPKKRTFQELPRMKIPRKWCGTSVLNGKVYVVGGFTDINTPSCTVESFDPVTNEWIQEKPLADYRAQVECVTVKMC